MDRTLQLYNTRPAAVFFALECAPIHPAHINLDSALRAWHAAIRLTHLRRARGLVSTHRRHICQSKHANRADMNGHLRTLDNIPLLSVCAAAIQHRCEACRLEDGDRPPRAAT